MEKLNGWQRIGVIASTLWIIIVGLCTYVDTARVAGNYANTLVEICKAKSQEKDINCWDSYTENWNLIMHGIWFKVAIFSLLPVLIGWPTVYIIISIVRWGRKGFAK